MTTPSPLRPLRVAIAGIGFIGQVHIESLRRVPGLEVVALCHSSQAAAEEKARAWCVPAAYSDYGEMLAKEKPDCVHVATPNNLHYSMVEKALRLGIHVVCEKPLAVTATEAEALADLAREKGVVNAVHFNVRYYPLVREMKRLREKGELGPIHAVLGSYLQDWLLYATDYNWRISTAQSGDTKAVADIGSHLIDLIEYVSGLRVSAVMADFATVHPFRKKPKKAVETYSGKMLDTSDYEDVPIALEDLAHILLRFEGGARGMVAVSQVAAGRKNDLQVEFCGAKAAMSWDSRRPNELWLGSRDTANRTLLRDPSLVDPETRALISYPGGHNEGFGDTFKQLYREVYDAVRTGTPPAEPKYPTFAAGCRQLALCEKIVESQRRQAWVEV
ncbi:dehydrogenase [Verrucomicrobia bacterium LW23]|nr:dehydrogenase [Verrucomicrobia bacterium LW23]